MTKKKPNARKGVRRQKDVTPEELARVQQSTEYLIQAYNANPEEAHEAGVTPEQVHALEIAQEQLRRSVKLPRMKAVAMAALRGGISAEEAKVGYFLAIRAFHAMAPWILVKAAEKMDDHQAPGSTRVILEMLKGSGIFQPAEPISRKKRLDQLTEEIVDDLPVEELRNRVLDFR